jgi:hypothetical protein
MICDRSRKVLGHDQLDPLGISHLSEDQVPHAPIDLIWDVFAAHRCEAARARTQSMGILLEFIPAGTTGESQTLDRRIFGNLKDRVKAWFDRLWSMNVTPTIEDSIDILLKVWKLIQQDEITNSWEPILRLRSN